MNAAASSLDQAASPSARGLAGGSAVRTTRTVKSDGSCGDLHSSESTGEVHSTHFSLMDTGLSMRAVSMYASASMSSGSPGKPYTRILSSGVDWLARVDLATV